ncbi:hypothetical protein Q7P37_011298 [Cladosporium fusiforme]
MIAVAGAIVAQIAITALSLDYLEESHWTAGACFVISLIAGLLSVYFACMVQVQLGDLHSPTEVRQWLIMQRAVWNRSSIERRTQRKYLLEQIQMMEMRLLNWSLASLLVGIGIYYGLVLTKNLGEMSGTNANLAILLTYSIFTAGALASFFIPKLYKITEEASWLEKYQPRIDELLQESQSAGTSEKDAVVLGNILHQLRELICHQGSPAAAAAASHHTEGASSDEPQTASVGSHSSAATSRDSIRPDAKQGPPSTQSHDDGNIRSPSRKLSPHGNE